MQYVRLLLFKVLFHGGLVAAVDTLRLFELDLWIDFDRSWRVKSRVHLDAGLGSPLLRVDHLALQLIEGEH